MKVQYIAERNRTLNSNVYHVDKRGKHRKQARLSCNEQEAIMNHTNINKFPAYKNHYSRTYTFKKYLLGNLSGRKIYRLYIEER